MFTCTMMSFVKHETSIERLNFEHICIFWSKVVVYIQHNSFHPLFPSSLCVCGIRVLFRLLTCWRIELFRKLVRCPSIYVCSSALSAFVLNFVSKTTTLSDWDWFDKGSVTREEEKKTNICRIYSNGQFWKYYTNQWMIYTLLALELAPNKPFANLSALLCPHMWTQDE